jgi:hypothetical protein
MRDDTVSQESTEGTETGPESDDIDYFPTPHRQLVAVAGRLARAEQQRLERQYQLANGRTPRPG